MCINKIRPVILTFVEANLDSDIAPISHSQMLLPYTWRTPHRGSLNFIVSVPLLFHVPIEWRREVAKGGDALREIPLRNWPRVAYVAAAADLFAADSSGL